MIARVRPSLNGAREALKTWDEASVVWPRFEVRLLLQLFDFTQQHRHHFLLTKEGFRAGGNEIKFSKAAGSECGSSHLRGNFRLALCTAVQRDEKAETKTVEFSFQNDCTNLRVICTTAVLNVIRKTQKSGGLETSPLPLQFPPPPILIDIDLIIPKV
jgi:ATP-binding cassette subfamily C (CFTR/MRP) protein 5